MKFTIILVATATNSEACNMRGRGITHCAGNILQG